MRYQTAPCPAAGCTRAGPCLQGVAEFTGGARGRQFAHRTTGHIVTARAVRVGVAVAARRCGTIGWKAPDNTAGSGLR